MKKSPKRKEVEDKCEVIEEEREEERENNSFDENLRREMCEKVLRFIDKNAIDEIRELIRYGLYEDLQEFVNPWIASEVHGILNDVSAIQAAIDDQQ
ncbi:hypothetical protein EROM_050780 [Encephalitozoon romaleae SJ-2008]|uniref:Uncharacterized protein n=1 Tax=Encephalitozoon romaleae (strain SJ-2008) TaxID=1178016 RepID=I7AEC7_ENCRO|nr:hypothetical protein EROM_050780 [Encephalitozoon romaleae SJ-2008]AFN83010.1 hypothetical protein EROM_050780 [Encephalitozoon romaleae SJ-2008]